MSFSYSLGSNPVIDYPRMLVGDTVSTGHVFEDEEIMMATNIDQFGSWAGGSGGISINYSTPTPRFVAATLLEALASNRARLVAALEVLDIRIDPSKAASELRAVAEAHRNAERNSGAFAIVEMVEDSFSARERVWKQLLRLYG